VLRDDRRAVAGTVDRNRPRVLVLLNAQAAGGRGCRLLPITRHEALRGAGGGDQSERGDDSEGLGTVHDSALRVTEHG
jgi:hypothetical protein